MSRDPIDYAALDALARSANPAGSAVASAREEELLAENARLRAGLALIAHSAHAYGAAWCVAQARGHLLDLDYDAYPETGRPEPEPPTP